MSQPRETVAIITSILLFIVALTMEQIYDIIILYFTIPTFLYQIIYLLIPVVGLVAFALFVKLTKSTYKRQGYKKPAGINTPQCALLSIFFLIVYLSIVLFAGFFGSFGPFIFPTSPYALIFRIAIALTYGFASESVFRGYIFRNLVRKYGLFKSLYLSSILFSTYTISIRETPSITEDPILYVFTKILPEVASGLFLGFFFYKIRWSLLGPLIFRIGFLFFFEPRSLMYVTAPWWIALTFEMLAYAILILLTDFIIKEPKARRRKYGFQ